jgi:hypothetical protein
MVATVHLRALGHSTGYKVRLPSTWGELLSLSSRLLLGGNSTRLVFDAHGDRLMDIDVVNPGDVLYASAGQMWRAPPPSDERKAGKALRRNHTASGFLRRLPLGSIDGGHSGHAHGNHGARGEGEGRLAELLLSASLRATPVRRSDETPARLCSGRPPWGLMGDPTQLGSDANFSRLRGAVRQQAHVALCVRTARQMQRRNRETIGRQQATIFPSGGSCAIVGSSGSLTGSRLGTQIDAHDVVMRFNLAPAGGAWGADVGNRTTVRVLTDKVVAPFLKASTARFSRASEPHSTLLLYCMAQGWVGKCMHEARVAHVNPVFAKHLRAELDQQHGRGRLPSAGITGMAMAIAHCGTVTLYGFGNASDAKQGNGTTGHALACGHYWECSRQQGKYFAGKQGYHDWNAQWRVLSAWLDRVASNATLAGALRFVDPVRDAGRHE